jgi:acetyl esterase/lipase
LDALVSSAAPTLFVWHTAEDIYVPPEHTHRLAAALAAKGVPRTVHVFAHGPTSLGLAENTGEAAMWTSLAAQWISRIISAARPETHRRTSAAR